MILATLDVPFKQSNKPTNSACRHWVIAQCDTCGRAFVIKKLVKARTQLGRLHFCGSKCFGTSRSSGAVLNKARATSRERYGTDNPSQSDVVKERTKATFVERFGVENPFQSEEVKLKAKRTLQERYGVDYPSQSLEIQSNIDWSAATKKAHETRKRNGTYGKETIPERWCYEALCSVYGIENVERHALVNDWDIDFYVASIDVYVQEDGVYYHGLDRPVEIIREFKTPTDINIANTWARDIQQNAWFVANGKRLVRIRDLDVKAWHKANILETRISVLLG